MPFRVHATIRPEDVPDFIDEVEDFLVEWRYQLMRQFERESLYAAQILTMERLPSGGASYYDAIQWRNIEESPTRLVSDLYNDHPWAWAVEEGTPPHRIPSQGQRWMRAEPTLAIRGGKERPYGTKYGNKVIYGYRFNHPGARAFRIFRHTLRRIINKKRELLKKSFWAAGGT